jgi:hypothetical protein
VGYKENSKAYKIFILAKRKTIVSKDVKFQEDLASTRSQESLIVIEDVMQEHCYQIKKSEGGREVDTLEH